MLFNDIPGLKLLGGPGTGIPKKEILVCGGQWTPRGDVLRCIIEDGGPDGEAVIHVDDHELSLAEFGRLLTTYAGWGMRIVFVPDDRTYEEPEITICDPNDENE